MHLGAAVAARDWHERGAQLSPLPSADPQRFLLASGALLNAARAAFAGQPGLEAPDLAMRVQKAAISLASARSESLTSAASGKLQERRLVLLEQIAEALAEQKSVEEEMERLSLSTH